MWFAEPKVLGVTLNDIGELSDGVSLCRLVTKLAPGSIPSVREGASSLFHHRENVGNFLQWCSTHLAPSTTPPTSPRTPGVAPGAAGSAIVTFGVDDLVERKCLPRVVGGMVALARELEKEPWRLPPLNWDAVPAMSWSNDEVARVVAMLEAMRREEGFNGALAGRQRISLTGLGNSSPDSGGTPATTSGSTTPREGARTPPPPPSVVQGAINSVAQSEMVAGLQRRVTELEGQCAGLKTQISLEQQAQAASVHPKVAALEAELRETAKARDSARSDAAQLAGQVEKLKEGQDRKVAELQSRAQAAEEGASVKLKVQIQEALAAKASAESAAKAAKEELSREKTRADKRVAGIEALEKRVKDAEEAGEKTRQQLSEALKRAAEQAGLTSSAAREAAELRAQLERTKQQLSDAEVAKKAELESVSRDSVAVQVQVDDLKAKWTAAQNENETLRLQVREGEQRLDALSREVETSLAHGRELCAKTEEAETKIRVLAKALRESRELQEQESARVQKFEASEVALKEQIQSAEEGRIREVARFDTEASLLARQLTESTRYSQELERNLAEAREQNQLASGETKAAAEALLKTRAEVESLRAALEASRAQHARQLGSENERIIALEKRLDEAVASSRETEATLDALKQSSEKDQTALRKQLEREREEAKSGMESTSKELSQALMRVSELENAMQERSTESVHQRESHSRELSVLQKSLNGATSKITELEDALRSAEGHRETSAKEQSKLLQELEDSRRNLGATRDQGTALASQSEALRKTVGNLETLVKEKDAQADRLRTQLRETAEKSEAETARLSKELSKSCEQSARAEKELASLRGDLERVAEQSQGEASLFASQLSDRTRELEEAQQRYRVLEENLAKAQRNAKERDSQVRDEMERHSRELATAEQRSRELEKGLKQAESALSDAQEHGDSKVQELLSSKRKLDEELKEAQGKASMLASQLAQRTKACEEAQSELSRSRESHHGAEERCGKLQAELRETDRRREELSAQLVEAGQRAGRQEKELQTLSSTLEKKEKALRSSVEESASAKAECAALRQAAAEVEGRAHELERLKTETAGRAQALDVQLASEKRAWGEARAQLEARVALLEKEREKREEDLSNMTFRVDESSVKLATSTEQVASLEGQLRVVQANLDASEQDRRRSEARFTELEKTKDGDCVAATNEIARLKQQLSAAMDKIATLEKNLEMAQTKSQEVDKALVSSREQVATMEAQRDSLRKTVSNLEEVAKQKDAQAEQLRAQSREAAMRSETELTKLKQSLSDSKSAFDKLTEALKETEGFLQASRERCDVLVSKRNQAEAELGSLRENLDKVAKESKGESSLLATQLTERTRSLEDTQRQLEAAATKYGDLERDVKKLELRSAQKAKEVESAKKELLQSREQSSQQLATANERIAFLEGLQSKLQDAEKSLATSQDREVTLEAQRDAVRKTVANLEEIVRQKDLQAAAVSRAQKDAETEAALLSERARTLEHALERQKEDAAALFSSLSSSRAETAAAATQRDLLKSQLVVLQDAVTKKDTELRSLKQRLDTLDEQLGTTKQSRASLEAALTIAKEQASAAEAQRDALLKSVASQGGASGSEKERQATALADGLKLQVEEKAREVKALQQAADVARKQHGEELKRKEDDVTEEHVKYERLQLRYDELQKSTELANQRCLEIKNLSTKLQSDTTQRAKALEDEVTRLQTCLEEERSRADEASRKAEEAVEEAKVSRERLEEELATRSEVEAALREKSIEAKMLATIGAQEKSKLQEELGTIKKQQEDEKQRRAAALAAAKKAPFGSRAAGSKTQGTTPPKPKEISSVAMAKVEAELKEARQRIGHLQALAERTEKARQKLELQLEDDVTRLRLELRDAYAARDNAVSASRATEARLHMARRSVACSEVSSFASESSSLGDVDNLDLDALRNQLKMLRRRYSEKEAELVRTRTDLDSLSHHLDNVSGEAQKLLESRDQSVQERNAAQAKLRALEDKQQGKGKGVDSEATMVRKLDRASAEIEKLKNENATLSQECKNLWKRLSEATCRLDLTGSGGMRKLTGSSRVTPARSAQRTPRCTSPVLSPPG